MAGKSDSELLHKLTVEANRILGRMLRENYEQFGPQLDSYFTSAYKATLQLHICTNEDEHLKFKQSSNKDADQIARRARVLLNGRDDWKLEVMGRVRELGTEHRRTVYIWIAVVNILRHPPIRTVDEAVTALALRTENKAKKPLPEPTEKDHRFLRALGMSWG
jgi:hypothetical protein